MKRISIVAISIVGMAIIFSVNSKANAAEESIAYLLQKAREEVRSHKFDAAARDFKKVISLDNKNPEAYSGLGTIYVKKGDKKSAEQYFNTAISLNKDNATAFIGLGYIYFDRGDLEKAINSFKKVVSLGSKDSRGYEGLIRVYASYKGKDYKTEILNNLEVLKKIDPELARALSKDLKLK